jgi:hypothetical protein
VQPPKRHKPDPKPLKPIQERVVEQEMENVDAPPADKHGKTLGFDDSIHDAANFIDPKSLFVCMLGS